MPPALIQADRRAGDYRHLCRGAAFRLVYPYAESEGRSTIGPRYRRLADTTQMLGRFSVLSFTEGAIARFEQLKNLKLNVRHMDLRIAAITLEHGGTLVTRNLRDFRDVPSLAIEDWSA